MRGSHTIRWLNGGEEGGEELPCDDHVPLNEGAVGKNKKSTEGVELLFRNFACGS